MGWREVLALARLWIMVWFYCGDGDEWPEVHEKSWDEMTEEERRALHVLGYWQNNWKVEY